MVNTFDANNKYLITGAAGFIGYYLAERLLKAGSVVVGFDNMNDYYDVSLKEERLSRLAQFEKFIFIKGDLADKDALFNVFKENKIDVAVNLAAQAGVRYSIDNPDVYIQSNVVGFFHVLEACRHYPVKHLVYASSSSVYGGNEKIPFSVEDPVDHPVSLYAATKKSNELMAYSYGKLYDIPVTGLRFFTVYGPMGRPDMACFKFADKMIKGEPIQIYHYGDMYRDFTYIDDIVEGIERILCVPPNKDKAGVPYMVYNIGNNHPEKLLYFVELLEKYLGIEAKKEFLPMQPGDVYRTYADVDALVERFGYKPSTTLEEGIRRFAEWFLSYAEKNCIND